MTIRRLHVVLAAVIVCGTLAVPLPGATQPQPPTPPPAPTAPPPAPEQRKVTAIEVRGNRHIPTEQILAAVTNTKVGDVLSEDNLRADIRAINELGLFADTTARTEAEQDGVRVVFLVTENPVITEVIVEGTTAIPAEEIRRVLNVPTGQVLNLNQMREGTRAVQKLYEDRGYVLARVADTAIIPQEGAPDQARLRVRVAEGTVQEVRFTGLSRTRLQTVQRHLKETTQGSVFNRDALNRDLQRLFDTGLFESIQARPEPGTDPDTAVIVIQVVEARTRTIGGGVGYSTSEGLLGFVEYRDRNWRGLGQSLTLRAERAVQQDAGLSWTSYELTFSEPYFDPQGTELGLSLYSRASVEFEYHGDELFSRFLLQRTGAFIALGRPLDPLTTAQVRLKSEYTDFLPLPLPDGTKVDPSESVLTRGRVVSFALGAIRDTRDDRLRPTRGDRIALSAEVALQALGGDFGFTKIAADYQHIFPVGRAAIVGRLFVGRAAGGLPTQEKFRLGGPSTVRSYPSGLLPGEDSMFVVNLEYRFPLSTLFRQLGELQGIVFADAGNAPLQFTDVKTGYGVGLGVNTPLGLLRVDLAFGGPVGRQTWVSVGSPF